MKKLQHFSMLIGLCVILSNCGNRNTNQDDANINQGYIAYKNGANTEIRGKVTANVLKSGADAATVLQAALDNLDAQGGGELEIQNGVFVIEKTLELPSDVSVTGSGKATVLKLGKQNAAAKGIVFHAADKERITISELTLQGAQSNEKSTGVMFERTGFSVVKNVYALDFSGYGLWLKDQSFACKLENNYTSGNDMAGTFISDINKTRGGRFVPNKIIGGYSYAEDGNGFEFYEAICQDIVGSVVHLAKGHGIYMYDSTSNLISGNRIFMCQKDGIRIQDTYEMNISSNICGWNWGDNLTLDHCVWATVSANEFIDAGGREREGYGIYMKRGTKSVQVSNNAIFNWWDNKALTTGIYEGPDCYDNQITDNIVNYYKKSDVTSLGKNSIAAYNKGIPEPFAWPREGPDAPNVKPEDIKLNLHINESIELSQKYLEETNPSKK